MPSAIDQALASFARHHREARLEAILASGLASSTKLAPKRAKLGELALQAASDSVSRASLDLLGQILDSAKKWPALSVETHDKSLIDPAVVEYVLSRRIPLAIPKTDATKYRFWLNPWAEREDELLPEDQLALLGAHAWLGAVLVASLLPGKDRKRLGPALDRVSSVGDAYPDASTTSVAHGSSRNPDRSSAHGSSKRLAASAARGSTKSAARASTKSAARGSATPATGSARVFAGIDAHAAELVAFGTLDVFVPSKDSSDPAPGELWLHAIARPSVIARCPRVRDAIRAITPARLLRNTLQAEKLAPRVEDDDARALIEVAIAPMREPDTVMDYGNMQAVLVAPATKPATATPALEAAIAALVGEGVSGEVLSAKTSTAKTSKTPKAKTKTSAKTKTKTNAKANAKTNTKTIDVRARIADLASSAASLAPAIERLQARLVLTDESPRDATTPDASPREATTTRGRDATTRGAKQSHAHDEDFPAVAHLLDHKMPWWTLDHGIEAPQQLLDAGHYLFDSAATAFATPAPSAFPWELLITRVGEVMYRALAPATSKIRRDEFAEMLQLWLDSGIPARAKALRGADFVVPAAMVSGMDRLFATRLVTWGANRYFVRYFQPLANGRAGVRVLEHTRDGTFRVPDGVEMGEHLIADARFDDRAIRRVLELLETRGPVPFDASIATTIAQRTGLSEAAATLVWTAGYEPWLVGEKKRAEYGLERDALDAAERELAKPRLREIYVDAMPADPAQMYEPVVLAQRVADAWLVYRTARDAHSARREQAEDQGTN